jgi:hypothetical protein
VEGADCVGWSAVILLMFFSPFFVNLTMKRDLVWCFRPSAWTVI